MQSDQFRDHDHLRRHPQHRPGISSGGDKPGHKLSNQFAGEKSYSDKFDRSGSGSPLSVCSPYPAIVPEHKSAVERADRGTTTTPNLDRDDPGYVGGTNTDSTLGIQYRQVP